MNYKIIIADDEPILLSGIIHSCNWNKYGIDIVAQANNGKQVLELVEEYNPDIVITDIVMPVMDGVTLIQELNKNYPHIQVLVLSSFSEFNYVRECFKYGIKDYLLKPEVTPELLVEKIYSLCNKEDKVYVEKQYRTDYNKILSEYIENFSDENLEVLSSFFDKEKLILIGFSINDIVNYNNFSTLEVEKNIQNCIQKYFDKCNYGYINHTGYYIVLINFDFDSISSIINLFFKDMQKDYSVIKLFLSNEFYKFSDLKEHFDYIKNILSKRIYFNKCLIQHQTLVSCNDTFDFSNFQFSENLKNKNINNAINMIENYFSLINKYKFIDDYSIKRFTQNIVYTVINTLENMNIKTSLSQEKIKIFKKIDIAMSIDDLLEIIFYTLQITKDNLNYQNDNSSYNLVDKAKQYIDENYMYDINLKELAVILHVNYTYLSTYFKTTTGESLTGYINNKRINEAKKLLKNTNKFVFEISMEIGFSDHNYFSKVFKKITGLTPHEYRLSLK